MPNARESYRHDCFVFNLDAADQAIQKAPFHKHEVIRVTKGETRLD